MASPKVPRRPAKCRMQPSSWSRRARPSVSHSGSLGLTYSYIGAYKVTVPAGTYDAALIKWTYNGSVGPANIEDTQYRFLAEDVGVVASVDKKDISAMLIYNDHSKYGKVLVSRN